MLMGCSDGARGGEKKTVFLFSRIRIGIRKLIKNGERAEKFTSSLSDNCFDEVTNQTNLKGCLINETYTNTKRSSHFFQSIKQNQFPIAHSYAVFFNLNLPTDSVTSIS